MANWCITALRYGLDPAATRAYAAIVPIPPTRSSIACRAILDKQIIHIRDMDAEPSILQAARDLGIKSNIALPLIRDHRVIGVFVLDANETGGFSDSQVALLKTFAEQAVIAIGSAETYRALQNPHGRPSGIARIPNCDQRCAEGDQPRGL